MYSREIYKCYAKLCRIASSKKSLNYTPRLSQDALNVLFYQPLEN